MEDKKLKTTVDDFLEETNSSKDKKEKCTTQECRMKNGEELLERIDKKLVTNDGRELLIG
jgi:hypothetical protein